VPKRVGHLLVADAHRRLERRPAASGGEAVSQGAHRDGVKVNRTHSSWMKALLQMLSSATCLRSAGRFCRAREESQLYPLKPLESS